MWRSLHTSLEKIVHTCSTSQRGFHLNMSDKSPVDLHFVDYPAVRVSTHQHKPLVIIHGLLGQSTSWRNLVSKTAMRENRRVICVDLRNHGQSPHSCHFSYEAMSNDIIHVLDRLGLDQVDLLGHSLGGKVAMATAVTHGTRIHDLVVADIAPGSYLDTCQNMKEVQGILKTVSEVDLSNQADRQNIDTQLARGIPQVAVRQFVATNLAPIPEGQPNPTNAKFYWKPAIQILLENYDKVRSFELPEHYEKFYRPVLFLRGGNSSFINPETLSGLADPYFANIELQTIEGAGHWLHSEKPNEFIERVITFLNKNE